MGFSLPSLARRAEWGLALRLALAIVLPLLFLLSFRQPGMPAVRIVLGIGAAFAIWALWYQLGRTNRAVARFIDAVRYDDFAQRFGLGKGVGFDRLGEALDGAIIDLGKRRMEAADEARFLGAIVDDAPIALLTIHDGDRVRLLNKAARRQFGAIGGNRLQDFAVFGSEFVSALAQPAAGRRLTRMAMDGTGQRTILESARVERMGEDVRIVSLLPVQNMLGSAEMAAQGDLVRVLTHEIMNSLTPVTSLARTAADLLAASPLGGDPELAEARTAIDTVARRAEGMHRFVESYRSFASAPVVHRRSFEAAPWADEILRIFVADPTSAGVRLVREIADGLQIDGDPQLLAQLSLNILRNAAAAAGAGPEPLVRFHAARSATGAVLLEVADNGPGIPPERREDIFLPFYTTRAEGHGVGLSFVRQVTTAHGGSIAVEKAPEGGALFRIILP
ncbi:sensor histidine kinase [Sandaracinobacteroides hominis]|uniref:sensor histidine kinase n=1 Tax=Sandaracinobacteroides hominis TaxID=2780086 RepID=UPI0018F59997|nr:HAMP domain-containing sensor histidine kinase [Sandaracinobacteroides hominis]